MGADGAVLGSGRGRRAMIAVAVAALLLVGVVPAGASDDGTLDDACPGPALPAAGFSDVGDGATHRATIDCLVWHGITEGRSWARFDPGGAVRRDEVASLLARTMERAGAELPAAPDDHFDDVAAGTTHARSINQLAEIGVISGTSARRYSPERLVSRAQAAALLVRGFEQVTGETLPQGTDRFDDTDGSTHEVAIDQAAEAGIVQGVGDRRFAPSGSSTRAQMASLLARLLDTFAERDLVTLPPSWGVDAAPPALAAQLVTDDVSSPSFVTAPPGDERLFVVELGGRVRIVEDGTVAATPFLDLSSQVSTGGEGGLFALAFHADYADNGRFFVHYTDTAGDTRIDRFEVSSDPDRADLASRTAVLMLDQPASNHNGGMIQFGPDGMLYVALGDGGGAGDPNDHGQDPTTLYGTILRLDVDVAATGYRIPADNPFASGRSGAPEVWAYGLRNPWRFAFDPPTGHLYVADVGQGAREEVDVVPGRRGGLNFGWNTMEGSTCFGASSCDRDGLTLPVYEYGHDAGCSITGGFVYRGDDIPGLVGHYVFGDYCGGWVRSLHYGGDGADHVTAHDVGEIGNVYSFGVGGDGELYVATPEGVFRLVAAQSSGAGVASSQRKASPSATSAG
ncbi:MAG TPA: PQQ-dependent sugar dehydrogenase [Egicoccus sp.]|nr:PQQ-dependent sugar dehydrogenase [Egicoccus sp.]HSK21988.1 PQQ-dependent sugar dehydrogenase [Egicoccus sp.]